MPWSILLRSCSVVCSSYEMCGPISNLHLLISLCKVSPYNAGDINLFRINPHPKFLDVSHQGKELYSSIMR